MSAAAKKSRSRDRNFHHLKLRHYYLRPRNVSRMVDQPAVDSGGDEEVGLFDVDPPAVDSPADARPAAPEAPPTGYVPPPPTPIFRNRRRLTEQESIEQRRRRAVRRRRRRTAGLILVGCGVLILAVGGWVAWRTYQAYSHLQAASGQVTQLQSEIRDVSSIDLTATRATVSRLQAESASAQSAVDDPFFRAATVLPWVGPNLHAMSEIAGTVRSLSTDVIPSLVQIAQTLRPSELAPVDGVVDLAPIEAASPLLQKADAAVNASRTRLAAIDRTGLVQQVNSAVLSLWGKLDAAESTTGAGARVARLLPPMLGANGPRTYLVVFQNLAEARATGGIFGSFAAVRVDQGRITIVDQGAGSRTLQQFDPPVTAFDAKATNLYGQLMGIYPQDVNLTPDFPTAAATFAKMYTARKGTAIDGVVATDPVALSYALKGTGAIAVGGGVTLTSKTIVPILLSTAYQKFEDDSDQAPRDAFLAHATTVAFSKVMSGTGDAGVIMAGLKQAVRERRVLVWSAHPAEQTDLAVTGLAGTMSTTSESPSIGVFLNDGTAAKLDYYLNNSVTVTPGDCQPDGRRQLHVALTLYYSAPTSGLPNYVLDTSAVGRRYEVQTNVLVFAPVGGGVVGATSPDGIVGLQRGEADAREVGQMTVTLKPGASMTIHLTLLGPAGPTGSGSSSANAGPSVTPALVLTPGVHPWKVSVRPYDACAITS